MVTREEIANIALLSKLYVPEDELDALTADMQKMIGFADMISAANVGDTGFDSVSGLQNVFREDEVVQSSDRAEILKNAGGEDGCFVVRRRG
ncbi:aspartyl/glutamyl-tRNA amidotransferase subunit C [Anaerotruncus rubiinfantis]|uniref:aspartyl/glutamyl-tRNA amidotransferase subunit C n=1 Tax=Anaerotruncus rubiinfantis TaxID=1720200 RepID=UPI0034A14EAA